MYTNIQLKYSFHAKTKLINHLFAKIFAFEDLEVCQAIPNDQDDNHDTIDGRLEDNSAYLVHQWAASHNPKDDIKHSIKTTFSFILSDHHY